MADRFPLIVNEISKKIEELVSGDNLDLTGNGIVVSGDTGAGKYLYSDGSTVFWNTPGDVYLTLPQTLTNKTLADCTVSGDSNTITNIANTSLVNSSITVNGNTIELGGTVNTPDTNTTYSISTLDGGTAAEKIVRLTDSDGTDDDITFAVSPPVTIPAGSKGLNLILSRAGDVLTFSGTVEDSDTVTTVQADSGGTAQTGAIRISGSGGATVTQNIVTQTINIDSANDNTVTRLKVGSGGTYASGDWTLLAAAPVTLSESTDLNGDPTVEIGSTDTITRVKGGTLGTFQSGDITVVGGTALGGNVAVSQTGNTIEIDSTDTNTVTEIASGAETMATGKIRFKQSGATTITQTTNTTTGEIEIEIDSLNTDTGAGFGAGTGITFSNNQFSIKNSANLIDNRIPIWDSANGQFANGTITDDGSTVTIDGDLNVLGTNTILETSTLIVEDNTIELRKGTSLTGSDAGIQVNRNTNGDGVVTLFNRMEWYEAGAYWRSYDGSVSNRLVTEDETQTLTNKTLTNPTLSTPTLGDATATTYNGLTIVSTSASSFDMADQKTLTVNNTMTLTSQDNATVNFDNGGGANAKVAYDSYHLGQFALTTSTQLSGKIQDKSGSGQLMFNTNPNIVDSISSDSNEFDLLNATVGIINIGGDATTIEIGAATGTTSINNALTVDGELQLATDATNAVLINGTVNVENADIQIRGTDAQPMFIGRGGGAVGTNTRVGYAALGANTTGSQNTAFGHSVLINNLTGAANTGFGYRALRDNDGGNNNVAIGKDALLINESGSGNVAIGVGANANNPGSGMNVCLGYYAGFGSTGVGNVLIGPADTEDSTSATYVPNSGDRQLVIGSGTNAWVTGSSDYKVTIPNDFQVDGDTRILGDLRVDGATVTVNSTTLTIDDKNIELASVANLTVTANVSNGSTDVTNLTVTSGIIVGMEVNSPSGAVPSGTIITAFNPQAKTASFSNAVSSENLTEQFFFLGPTDTAADGGGLIIKGTPVLSGGTGDKSITYDNNRTKKYFVSTENFELSSGKEYAIGNQLVLSSDTLGPSVVNSSLTSVGVLIGATGQPALEVDGATVLGGRVIEQTFSNMGTSFSLTSNTLSVTAAAANTICGETTTANQAINTWAFSTADPDGNTLANSQSLTITLIIDASTASTYGDACTVDGNPVATGVRWSGGSPPIATSNTDILTFLIVKDGAGVTRVYGQGNTDFS